MCPENNLPAIADRYTIVREIGRGGMATVYAAEDLKHHRRVAIKVLSPEASAELGFARFLREIEIAARLTHPHILPLHDSGAAGQQLYFVMPFVEDGSLRQRLQQEPPLTIEEAVRIACEVAGALAYAHAHSIVHRDIKPENILLSGGIGLVADFGIARALGGSASTFRLTQSGTLVGTPAYMAPEQATGGPVDERADLYSLGCVLYEMLAGEPPFVGANWLVVLQQHASAPPPPIENRRAVHSWLASAVHRALAKRPEDRFSSAARMAEALHMGSTLPSTPRVPPESELLVPNNLPKQRTTFVGRKRQLAECARLLGETGALTLTGVGGCGKTRLALRVAESLLESYPDGVWFVDLAPVSDADRVALAIASVLEVHDRPGESIATTVARAVRGKRMLLVLDNCEHVLTACAEIADRLLAERSQVRILATSRESLGIEGESIFTVRSLSLPETEASFGELKESESVQLFVDRARAAEPQFTLGTDTAPAIAEICRRLDGIPLAIELAAARLRVLSIEQIRTMLDDRFRLLTGGTRALPRHQTLRATIQWSYEHLDPDERDLLERLAVFAGSWTLAGAAAVVGEDEFPVLDRVSRLIDKSLVMVERRDSEEVRYRMLETVRQFAQERLDAAEEGATARTRHLSFYCATAAEIEEALLGPRQADMMARLRTEHENLVAAIEWALTSGALTEDALRLAGSLRHYWLNRGQLSLGIRLTVALLQQGDPAPATDGRALALNAAGFLEHLSGRFAEAREHIQEGLALYRSLGDEAGVMRMLGNLGNVEVDFGRFQEARRHFEESMAIARRLGSDVILADSMNCLAELSCLENDSTTACALYEEALVCARRGGSRILAAFIVLNLAREALIRADTAEARRRIEEAIPTAVEVGSEYLQRQLLDVAAAWTARQGAPERAARWWGAVESFAARGSARRWPADKCFVEREVAAAREGLGESGWTEAHRSGSQLSLRHAIHELRQVFASKDAPTKGLKQV